METIIRTETDLSLQRGRLRLRNWRVPLEVVVFEDKKKLGYYDPETNRIGIHRQLMAHANDPVIANIVRHEIAHLVTWFEAGPRADPHGNEFRATCRRFGWGAGIWSASCDIAEQNSVYRMDPDRERLVERVQKLLGLTSSANRHEAELATLRVNQILLKHNLDRLALMGVDHDQTLCLKRVLFAKRLSAKLIAISDILRAFLVEPVMIYGYQRLALEVVGQRPNVEIAGYVASFLEREFEVLWLGAKRENLQLNGPRAKNSFFRGIARGYVAKLEEATKRIDHSQQGLLRLQQELGTAVKQVYQRLGNVRSTVRECRAAAHLGHAAGRELSIHPAVQGQQTVRLLKV